MGKRRHPTSVNEHIKTVNELIDELPIHVKLEMNNRRKAEVESAEQEAFQRGFNSVKDTVAGLVADLQKEKQQMLADQKQAMIHLIHTFSAAIFMLGKGEGKGE